MDTELHIKTIGQGPAIIFLHGFGFNLEFWENEFLFLAHEFTLILVDLPGFGKSENFLESYTLSTIAHCILKNVPVPAIWVGWSMGGIIAMWIAHHFPKKVNKLITIACSPKFINSTDWPGLDRVFFNNFINKLLNLDNVIKKDSYKVTMKEFAYLQCKNKPLTFNRIDISHYKAVYEFLTSQKKCSEYVLRGSLELIKNSDLRHAYSKLSCPALVVLGAFDNLIPIKIAIKLQILNPNVIVKIIEGAAHIPFLSHRLQFQSIIKRFLDPDIKHIFIDRN